MSASECSWLGLQLEGLLRDAVGQGARASGVAMVACIIVPRLSPERAPQRCTVVAASCTCASVSALSKHAKQVPGGKPLQACALAGLGICFCSSSEAKGYRGLEQLLDSGAQKYGGCGLAPVPLGDRSANKGAPLITTRIVMCPYDSTHVV